VLAWSRSSDFPPVTRLIVNDPRSRTTTWPDLLGPTRQMSPNHSGRLAALKRAAIDAKITASACRLGIAAAIGRLGVPVGEAAPAEMPEPAERNDPIEPTEPVEFSGVMALLARRQPFLPPTPYDPGSGPSVATSGGFDPGRV
jgi:hypothetical protein